jgi:hypothetical protein
MKPASILLLTVTILVTTVHMAIHAASTQFVLLCRKLELFGGGRFEAFSTDVKDRSRKSRFSTFEWRSEFFIACGYSISWES